MLEIQDLNVSIKGEAGEKQILYDINMIINTGEIHALFGPNGSGKTTLIQTIMGFPQYKIASGKIILNGEDITYANLDERARMGIGMSFQRPPTISGVKTKQIVDSIKKEDFNVEEFAKKLKMGKFLDRDINSGFSGGEIKRAELLQLFAQDPQLVLLDEPTSGVDIENIKLIGDMTKKLLHLDRRVRSRKKNGKSALVITHTGAILEYIFADKGYVLLDGRMGCSGNPRRILREITETGYLGCINCYCEREGED